MAEKKCTACGSTDLSKVDMVHLLGIILEGGRSKEMPDSYACNICGHIDLYAQTMTLDRCQAANKAKAEKDAEVERLKKALEGLRAEEQNLNAIISDENQTVKTVRQAEADLNDVRKRIHETESKLNSLASTHWKVTL